MRSVSLEIFEASKEVIPGGVNSPVRAFPGLNITPLIAEKGFGDTVWDADGNRYIDYCGSWGALILGHADPAVVKAVQSQAANGSSFGMATRLEYLIAKHIIERMPSIEKIRFVSSGTEATMSAVRLARGYTGKNFVVKFDGNYHGHADSFLIRAGSGVSELQGSSSKGVPDAMIQTTVSLPYNDTETARSFLRAQEDIAAVILEPIAGNMGCIPASVEFIQMLRKETSERGIVLIFDEVITGFRVGVRGAQGLYGVTPDITCLGKIIGGGYPAAAFGGKAEIMNYLAPLGAVYQAGTLSGNSVALAAGLATLLQIDTVYDELKRKTDLLLDPIRDFLSRKGIEACIQSVGSMFTLFFGVREMRRQMPIDEELYRKLFVHLFHRGIYFPPAAYELAFVSTAHTDSHLEETAEAVTSFLAEL